MKYITNYEENRFKDFKFRIGDYVKKINSTAIYQIADIESGKKNKENYEIVKLKDNLEIDYSYHPMTKELWVVPDEIIKIPPEEIKDLLTIRRNSL
jgi:hypothetical protein